MPVPTSHFLHDPDLVADGIDRHVHLLCHGDGMNSEPPQSLVPEPAAVAVFPIELSVVALVASSGGLDALTRVLAPLPAGLPAAIVVALHQDPTQASLLAEHLDDRTALPVRAARDGDRLQIGHVLVTPPAAHLIITAAGVLGLIHTGAIPPARPSADLLLATLAVTAGPRVLAVVLTGTGHDAQAGIRAVHRCGGTVLAQDEASSAYFGMPSAAIATGLVHAVDPVEGLAAAIIDHVTNGPGT